MKSLRELKIGDKIKVDGIEYTILDIEIDALLFEQPIFTKCYYLENKKGETFALDIADDDKSQYCVFMKAEKTSEKAWKFFDHRKNSKVEILE